MASPEGRRSRPGRPRDHGLDALIRAATVKLLVERGEQAASVDDVAARAGVGKATIYRRWTSKRGLIQDALTAHLPIKHPATDHGSLAADARALLADMVALMDTPHARAGRQLLRQLATWPELAHAYREGVLNPWRTALHAVVTRAHARGKVPDPAPVQLLLEAAAARICLPWLADPETIPDPAGGADRVDGLVSTLIGPVFCA